MTDENPNAIHYRSIHVEGVDVFYREAGATTAPTLLLLHGFPTSSHMFRDLIPLLADRFHLVAPDYPGFGYSSAPSPREFAYTFDHLADVFEHFADALGLKRYALYVQDFGGPVGFRLATRRPERVRALIVQNANAYAEGVNPALRDLLTRAYRERSPATDAELSDFFERPTTLRQFLEGVPDPSSTPDTSPSKRAPPPSPRTSATSSRATRSPIDGELRQTALGSRSSGLTVPAITSAETRVYRAVVRILM